MVSVPECASFCVGNSANGNPQQNQVLSGTEIAGIDPHVSVFVAVGPDERSAVSATKVIVQVVDQYVNLMHIASKTLLVESDEAGLTARLC
jgi:hypothetical protein